MLSVVMVGHEKKPQIPSPFFASWDPDFQYNNIISLIYLHNGLCMKYMYMYMYKKKFSFLFFFFKFLSGAGP